MKRYGLPLIFKLTCPITGIDSFPHDLVLDRTPNPLAGANLYRIEGMGAKNFTNEPVMRQATGFTDAAGEDVYFGDVLMDDHSRMPYIVQMNDDQICALIADGLSDLVEVIYPQSGRFDCLFFVGNAYEPPARWLKRAREIWPGAELPEGGRG